MIDLKRIKGLGQIVRPWGHFRDPGDDSFGWDLCDRIPLDKALGTDYLLPEYCGYSDYSGSTVERANVEALEEKFQDSEHVFCIYGGYGSTSWAIRLDALTDEIIEILEGIQDYPCFDDEKLSEIEMEIEDECFPDAVEDFSRALMKKFPEIVDEIFDCENLDDFLRDKLKEMNIYPVFESAGSCYFDVDGAAKGATIVELKAFLGIKE